MNIFLSIIYISIREWILGLFNNTKNVQKWIQSVMGSQIKFEVMGPPMGGWHFSLAIAKVKCSFPLFAPQGGAHDILYINYHS